MISFFPFLSFIPSLVLSAIQFLRGESFHMKWETARESSEKGGRGSGKRLRTISHIHSLLSVVSSIVVSSSPLPLTSSPQFTFISDLFINEWNGSASSHSLPSRKRKSIDQTSQFPISSSIRKGRSMASLSKIFPSIDAL